VKMFGAAWTVAILLATFTIAGAKDAKATAADSSSSSKMAMFSFPSECSKEGKTYKPGDTWHIGHLRYRCGKFGLYEITGCLAEGGKELKVGEDFVEDNLAHQCFSKDSSVYYRMITCGVAGQPACNKVDHDTGKPGYSSSASTVPLIDQTHGLPGLPAAGLPDGWRIIDAKGNPVPLTGIKVISHMVYLPPSLMPSSSEKGRPKRQTGHGVGSVIGREEVGNERPSMPGMGPSPSALKGSAGKPAAHERVVGYGGGTMDLRTRLNVKVADGVKYKPGTVAGTRSDVTWSGKNAQVNGKTIGAGPGTFTFGRSRTGAFMRPQ